ncbi:MAG: class I SAM-dependent methyltransferase [Treponema sp.]|nr:class I SAM-dependent methyltransferase [Treponema sp.]
MAYREEWFNDEEFWKQYAPIMFDEKRWSEVQIVADGVTRLAGLNLYGEKQVDNKPVSVRSQASGPRIIDLCCGFGRITLELARRGFEAAGVDITASYLETAREDAAYEGLDIEFIQDDVRHFKRKNTYEAAVNLYNSFGYFEYQTDDLLFLKNALYSLREGGAFIIDVLGKEIAIRDYTEAEWFERAGFTVLTECMPVDSWASTWNRWILIKGGKRREKVFVQRLYAASELRTMMYQAGFSAVELYGNWDESPYDNDAQTLIAVGRK